jgi:hypothetical protein
MIGTMNGDRAAKLQVFVEGGCETCERALLLAREVESDYPRLAVQVTDLGESRAERSDVFAVPTFVLNDRVLSLGNPRPNHLRREIESLLGQHGLQ